MPWRHNNAYKSVLHGCIACMYSWASRTFTAEAENSPLCDRQHEIRQANPRFAGCIIRITEVIPLFYSTVCFHFAEQINDDDDDDDDVNTRCATSDVNPFKIRCNLQVIKATVSEMQWWHVIKDVTSDVKLMSAVNETQWLHVIT